MERLCRPPSDLSLIKLVKTLIRAAWDCGFCRFIESHGEMYFVLAFILDTVFHVITHIMRIQ